MTISARLWLASASSRSDMLAVTSVRTNALQKEARLLQERQEKVLDDASRWAGLTETNAQRAVASIVASDDAVAAHFKDPIAATTDRISELQKSLEGMATSDVEKAQLAKIAAARKVYVDSRKAALAKRKEGDIEGSRQMLQASVLPAVTAYLDEQRAFVTLQEKQGAGLRDRIEQERVQTVIASGVVALLVLAVMAIAGRSLIGSIVKPLRDAADASRRIGEGDLTVDVDTSRSDEIGELLRAVSEMRDSLRGLVGHVRQSAESIEVASSEVAQGNADLSQRTEVTASHLQQVASSMAQVSGTAHQSADSSRTANQLASSAATVAQRGGTVVSQVVSTMDEIQAAEGVGVHAQVAEGQAGVQPRPGPPPAGAGGHEEGQQVLVGRVHQRACGAGGGSPAARPVAAPRCARRTSRGRPCSRAWPARPCRRRGRRPKHAAQVVRDAAAAHDQHALGGQRRQRRPSANSSRRAPVRRPGQRQHRDVGAPGTGSAAASRCRGPARLRRARAPAGRRLQQRGTRAASAGAPGAS
jgi:methyl-accepting chemotaxis protein